MHGLPQHEQVLVKVGRNVAEIDELLAPLIREIWIAGIQTEESCQEFRDGEGEAWILFWNVTGFRRFLKAVTTEKDSPLYKRIVKNADDPRTNWRCQLDMDDLNRDREATKIVVRLSPALFFPQSDIPALVTLLKKYNRRQKALS
jgi:hypothetical protein